MLKLYPLDPACPIERELQATVAPVVLVNLFTVAEADVLALLAAYPSSAVSQPRLFSKVAVPNLCAA